MKNDLSIDSKLAARFVFGILPKTLYSNLVHDGDFQVTLRFEFSECISVYHSKRKDQAGAFSGLGDVLQTY